MNRSRTTHHPISLPTGKPYNLGPNNTNKHTHIYIYIYIYRKIMSLYFYVTMYV